MERMIEDFTGILPHYQATRPLMIAGVTGGQIYRKESYKYMKNRSRQAPFARVVKKFLLSAFVVVSFAAYALENRMTAGGALPTPPGIAATASATAIAGGAALGAAPTSAPVAQAAGATATAGDAALGAAPTSAPVAQAASATATSPAPSITGSGQKDGTYIGPVVDVNWGNVQVQATIQNGKISNVQFVQYPSDRRTSQRINVYADPVLQQEAVQAQSANVDIVTGATLTSEGFMQSLQAALSQAQG